MYPSSHDYNNHNPNNPTSLSDQMFPLFITETNSSSKFDQDLQNFTSSFHFPSPYIHQCEDFVNELTWQQLHDLFIQQQPFTPENSAEEIINSMDAADLPKEGLPDQQINVKKRTLKKDRHSKITTARGPRDRRMRLSLDVARKFFDLQDILGFDKASKTVEWLMIQSSSAIKEITRGNLPARVIYPGQASFVANTSVSSTSECEVLSGIDDATTINNGNSIQKTASISLKTKNVAKSPSLKKKEKKAKLARRTALHLLPKESRKVARERARKRTIEKRKLGATKLCLENSSRKSSDLKHLTSQQLEYAAPASDTSVITGNWNPPPICTYQQETEVPHLNQFSDLEFCSKTWEAYNNNNMSTIGA